MFIKIKRTQNCTSGNCRFGVVYEIDAKDPFQTRDAANMIKLGFAEKVDAPQAKKKASKKADNKVVGKAAKKKIQDAQAETEAAVAEAAAVKKAEIEAAAVKEAAELNALNAKSDD